MTDLDQMPEMEPRPSWIIWGPQGTGKPGVAKRWAERYGLRHVLDKWDGSLATYRMYDTVHITELPPNFCRTMFRGFDSFNRRYKVMAATRTMHVDLARWNLDRPRLRSDD